MSEESLRELIRYLHPLTRLRSDLEQSLIMSTHAGQGNAAVKTYTGLHAGIARFVDDPYLEALTLEVPPDAGDREKVSLAFLTTGQLLAYVQGQLGLSLDSKAGPHAIQTAPNVTIQNISGEAMEQAMEIARRALGSGEEKDEE